MWMVRENGNRIAVEFDCEKSKRTRYENTKVMKNDMTMSMMM